VKYVNLGCSGLKVSRICLGTMMFGGPSADAQAAKIVNMGRDAGVNFIDTAESYSGNASERVVGKLLKRDCDAWVVATKTGASPMGPGPNDKGLNRRRLMTAIDESLQRLKMDHVDVCYLHQADVSTPLEETLRTTNDIIRVGKVRYWGLSNVPVWQFGLIV
jgi:aryl-alcohol dehydrogenase-like predicted oxidoreductase